MARADLGAHRSFTPLSSRFTTLPSRLNQTLPDGVLHQADRRFSDSSTMNWGA